ncbi:MAG: ribosome-associated protein [Candidatus Tokpelaia sp. JSC161]|jgi:ribosome-associated protein|nr:MAG: ribosome-associated protein [Candidatus Tokpelaia sp. JSC161]
MKQLKEILKTLESAKAEEIRFKNLQQQSTLCDFIIIASGRSQRHIKAIADHLLKHLKKFGYQNIQIEGYTHDTWILIDTGDLIVHILHPERRSFYNLEEIWISNPIMP